MTEYYTQKVDIKKWVMLRDVRCLTYSNNVLCVCFNSECRIICTSVLQWVCHTHIFILSYHSFLKPSSWLWEISILLFTKKRVSNMREHSLLTEIVIQLIRFFVVFMFIVFYGRGVRWLTTNKLYSSLGWTEEISDYSFRANSEWSILILSQIHWTYSNIIYGRESS